MKLLKWTMAGATAFVVYKYSIGKKAKGEDVFVSPDRALADDSPVVDTVAAKPRRRRLRPGK